MACQELRRGGVGIVFATIFVFPREVEEMAQDGLAQLRYYDDLLKTTDGLHLITTKSELAALRTDWDAASDAGRPARRIGAADGGRRRAARSLRVGDVAASAGCVSSARRGAPHAMPAAPVSPAASPIWDASCCAKWSGLGMVLDMSHIAEESFWQALDIFSGPVIASHSNCRVYVPTDRQLTDEMIPRHRRARWGDRHCPLQRLRRGRLAARF